MANEQKPAEQIKNINNSDMDKVPVIKSANGLFFGEKLRGGDEARVETMLGPACGINDCCITPIESFDYYSTTAKQITDSPGAYEDSAALMTCSQLRPLIYTECFTSAIRHRVRLVSITIVAGNHDKTLFATDTNGTINNQTIYYPSESDQIFAACDCLRFNNTAQPCEHLALIALTEIFSSNFGTSSVTAE